MAKMNLSKPDTILMFLLGIVLAVEFFAGTIDTVLNSLATLAGKSIPLAGLFGSSGVVILIIVASFIVMIVKGVNSGK